MDKTKFELFIRQNIEKYAFPVQGKVIKGYVEGKEFFCNCIELDIDGSETEVIIPKIKVPKVWGKLEIGAIVNIAFLKGNKNFPVIMSVEGKDYAVPVDLKTFLQKLLETIIAMKTVGSPPQHTVSPDDIIKFTQLREIDLKKLLE